MEIEEAVSILEKNLSPLGGGTAGAAFEEVALCDALGRILFEDIFAPMNVPPFAKSAMDGYAVRAEDVAGAGKENPVELCVVGELFAGDWREIPYKKKSAVRVMTGSPVPQGFDAVVMQEDTDYGQEKVLVYDSVRRFENYCAEGEDIKKGSLVLRKGKRIGRVEAALLASLGISFVKVRVPARVSVLATGSELVCAGKHLAPGKIYSSVGELLCASIKAAGLAVAQNKILIDDEDEIRIALKGALESSDFVITTGGISVGKKDLLPKVLSDIGAKTLFTGVNVQPGTPTTASVLDGKVILSLSGNPYAAMANFDIYFYRAAAVLMGSDSFVPKVVRATLCDECGKVSKRRRFLRARLEGGSVFLPSQSHAASVISNVLECNAYVDVPAGKALCKGDEVCVWSMGASL